MSDEDQLSPAERELETALRSLRPTPARINPVVAAHAAGRRTAPVRSRFWQVAAAAALIAAVGGAWVMLGPRGQLPDRVERQTLASELPLEPPTWIVYRQALARSPAELEALLDLQGMSESARDQFTPVGMVTVWNANLRSLPGEM